MGIKISALNAANTLSGTELVPVVQDGVTVKTTSSTLKTTNATELTTGTVAIARLPASSTSFPGIIQIGTTLGTACEGNDGRLSKIGGGTGFLIFNTVGANQSIPANAIPAWVAAVKVTIIAGGGGSGYGTSGGNGDSSSFSLNGITITATGGTGGSGSPGGSGGTGGSVSGVSGYVGSANGGTGASSGNVAQDGAFSVNVGIGMGGGGGGAGAGGGSGNGFGGSSNYLRSISTPSGTFSANGGGAATSIQGGIIGGGSGGYGVGKSGFLYGGGGGTSSSYWGGGGGGAAVFQIAITGGVLYTNAITVGAGGIAGSVNAAAGAQGVVVIEW